MMMMLIVVIIIIVRSHLASSVRVACEGRLLTNDVVLQGDCVQLHRQVLLCDLASGRVDPDELSAATNETLARRGSGGAAPCLGPPMLHPAREEHVANVFMVRYLAWLCSG